MSRMCLQSNTERQSSDTYQIHKGEKFPCPQIGNTKQPRKALFSLTSNQFIMTHTKSIHRGETILCFVYSYNELSARIMKILLLHAIFLLAIQFPQFAALHSAGAGACTAAIREAGHHMYQRGVFRNYPDWWMLLCTYPEWGSSKQNKIAAFSRVCSSAAVCTCST